jgi:cytochrome c oxidase subunit 1
MFYTMLPKLAGGKLYSDAAGRLVFILFVLFSVPVGLHHQFAEPAIQQGWKIFHMILTFGVGIPSVITAFTIAASLEYAGRKNGSKGLFGWMGKLPWFDPNKYLVPYLMCGLIIFIFGGATGIVNASYNLNMLVHNTGWMPGHFHMTVAGPVFLAILGGSVLMLSSLSGKKVKFPKLNVWVPYLWMIGLFMFSGGLMIGGLDGEPRRTNMGLSYLNPESDMYRPEWVATTALTAIGGTVMFLSCVFYFIVFFGTMFSKPSTAGVLEFPQTEAYHDGKRVRLLDRLVPWTVVAVVMIAISYYQPIKDSINYTGPGSPRYLPENPMPQVSQPADAVMGE